MNHSGHNNIVASPRSSRSSSQAPQPRMAPPPKALDPLQHLLSDVIARLEVLETKAGVVVSHTSSSSSATGSSALERAASSRVISSSAGGEVPAVKAFDSYMKQALTPFIAACDGLTPGMGATGALLRTIWEGMRSVIVLASRSKLPPGTTSVATDLQAHLPTDAIKEMQQQRLSRDLDWHSKALAEILVCVSWVLYRAPQQLPSGLVKEALGSAEFWTNRIRKDKKGDATHIAFCDALKTLVVDLVAYIETHHKTGLTFNPKGVSLAEAAIVLTDAATTTTATDSVPASPKRQSHPTLGNVVASGNVAGLMGELTKRKTADGSSAATGLKHVTKDQQTWRKEYSSKDGAKTKAAPTVPTLDTSQRTVKTQKKKPRGLPVFEYQDRGFKWVIENQTDASKVVTVDITDPKQQVYLYNCEGITVQINGKFKSLALDACEKCAVVYDTLISSSEIVNCQKIQLQVKGICPVFTIDKTRNVLIWLSEESKAVSTFTTSLSSEMNVSFPDGQGDQKEMPIPEQFVHKVTDKGTVSSDVSDLYH